MSDIHIGPHTRRDDATAPHGAGETHHTYDREINLKAIGKWMLGLLVVTIVVQVLSLYFLRGLRSFDEKQDPALTPIQRQVEQKDPPAPRLQVGAGFEEHNAGAISRSDLEDMQLLREQESKALDNPSWIDQGQGRVRVPIDVAMEVIASRGGAGGGAGTAAPQAPPEQPNEQPAGTTAQPPASQEQ